MASSRIELPLDAVSSTHEALSSKSAETAASPHPPGYRSAGRLSFPAVRMGTGIRDASPTATYRQLRVLRLTTDSSGRGARVRAYARGI
jgi:hypothetical protein